MHGSSRRFAMHKRTSGQVRAPQPNVQGELVVTIIPAHQLARPAAITLPCAPAQSLTRIPQYNFAHEAHFSRELLWIPGYLPMKQTGRAASAADRLASEVGQ